MVLILNSMKKKEAWPLIEDDIFLLILEFFKT